MLKYWKEQFRWNFFYNLLDRMSIAENEEYFESQSEAFLNIYFGHPPKEEN